MVNLKPRNFHLCGKIALNIWILSLLFAKTAKDAFLGAKLRFDSGCAIFPALRTRNTFALVCHWLHFSRVCSRVCHLILVFPRLPSDTCFSRALDFATCFPALGTRRYGCNMFSRTWHLLLRLIL